MIILHTLVLPFSYYFNHGRCPLSCVNQCHRPIHRPSFSMNVNLSGPVCYSNKACCLFLIMAYFHRLKYCEELSGRAGFKWRDACFNGQWRWRVLIHFKINRVEAKQSLFEIENILPVYIRVHDTAYKYVLHVRMSHNHKTIDTGFTKPI